MTTYSDTTECTTAVRHTVDAFGFLAPHDTHGATIDPANTQASTSGTPWTTEDLRREEGWWASDFLLYLSWRAAQHDATVSTDTAAAPCDSQLIEQWFWRRWEERLRSCGGCPHMSLRALLWGFFSGAWQRGAQEQADECAWYETVVHSVDTGTAGAGVSPGFAAAMEAIDRDLGRTFPHHILFVGDAAGAPGQQQLRRLLLAYAAHDPEVGYCQGMAFVAAVVLMVAPESQAFQVFCGLMREAAPATQGTSAGRSSGGGRHGMRQLYSSGFPLLQTLLAELERHVASLLPALAAHLKATDVHIAMFASRWFLTLFVHQLPPPVLLRVWDFFLVKGWSVMVQVAVALLHQEQGTLLRLNMEGILLHLKVVRSRQQSEGELLRRVCNVPIL